LSPEPAAPLLLALSPPTLKLGPWIDKHSDEGRADLERYQRIRIALSEN
jgi:hypothetical protein